MAAVTADETELIAVVACPEKQQSRIRIRFLAGLSAKAIRSHSTGTAV